MTTDRDTIAAALIADNAAWEVLPKGLDRILDAVVPVVDAIAARRAAQELRAAANSTVCAIDRHKLNARAQFVEAGEDPDSPVYAALDPS